MFILSRYICKNANVATQLKLILQPFWVYAVLNVLMGFLDLKFLINVTKFKFLSLLEAEI